MFLLKTLSTLKSQLDTDNKWQVIGREGEIHTVGFRFNEAADKDSINIIKKQNDWHIPRDYETFLLQHNGANLFELYLGDTNIGGGLILYSFEEIRKVQRNLQWDNDFYPIGYVHENHLMIKNSSDSQKYLYIGYLDKEPLKMTFETFLDIFIVSNGSNFWEWT